MRIRPLELSIEKSYVKVVELQFEVEDEISSLCKPLPSQFELPI